MQPHLRPTDAGEILDGAFTPYRRHPRAFTRARGLPLPAAGAWRGGAYGEAPAA